jgi:hypothetical protein
MAETQRWARGKPAPLEAARPADRLGASARAASRGRKGPTGLCVAGHAGEGAFCRSARAGLAGSAASRDFGSTTSARTLEYALEEIEDSTKEVNEIGSAEDYYLRFHFPEYLSREKSLQAIRGKLQELRARLEREAAEKDG